MTLSNRADGAVASPSTWGVYGHYNRWGGFHTSTDRKAYLGLVKVVARRPWRWGYWRLAWQFGWEFWRHRRCDTTDFHHYACTLEFYNRVDNACYRMWDQLGTKERYAADPTVNRGYDARCTVRAT